MRSSVRFLFRRDALHLRQASGLCGCLGFSEKGAGLSAKLFSRLECL